VNGDAERERVAEELRRVREGVRERALLEPRPAPPPPAVRTPEPVPREPEPPPPPAPARPDNADLNRLWALEPPAARGRLRRVLDRARARFLARQRSFNARQVQFDNELLAYVEARLEAVHRQYDDVLGIHRRHMAEIDQRHLILQEELVAHVHDLVRRIDLVLSESERGRLGLESALRDLRARLLRLEERLPRG
jgi:hypothetical protein